VIVVLVVEVMEETLRRNLFELFHSLQWLLLLLLLLLTPLLLLLLLLLQCVCVCVLLLLYKEWGATFTAERGDACLAEERWQVAERSYPPLTIQVDHKETTRTLTADSFVHDLFDLGVAVI